MVSSAKVSLVPSLTWRANSIVAADSILCPNIHYVFDKSFELGLEVLFTFSISLSQLSQVLMRQSRDVSHKLPRALEYVKHSWPFYNTSRPGSHVVMHPGENEVRKTLSSSWQQSNSFWSKW